MISNRINFCHLIFSSSLHQTRSTRTTVCDFALVFAPEAAAAAACDGRSQKIARENMLFLLCSNPPHATQRVEFWFGV